MSVSLKLLSKIKIVQEIYQTCVALKVQCFFVGGIIRDLLLGRPPGRDIDMVCLHSAETLAKELAVRLGGHAFLLNDGFGTWRVVVKRVKKNWQLDLSPLHGSDIGEDLRQRDFTVNSMALPWENFLNPTVRSLIDPTGGREDIHQKKLRANSEEGLIRDPLRMLRAFRFSYTLGLSIEKKTLEMIERNKERIAHCAMERIRQEFFTGLNLPQGPSFLQDLQTITLLREIVPEIEGWERIPIGFQSSLLDHGLRTAAAADFILKNSLPLLGRSLKAHFSEELEEGVSRRALFLFLAFLHDSGKSKFPARSTDEGTQRFWDHDQEGEKINFQIGRRMKLSRKSLHILSLLTRHHMRLRSLAQAEEWTDRAKYRFFRDFGKEGIEALCLAVANEMAKGNGNLPMGKIEKLPEGVVKICRLVREFLRDEEVFRKKPLGPLLSGEEIMKHLHVPQGEGIGILLRRLHEAELAGKVQTKEAALAYLKSEYAKMIDKFRYSG